MKDWLTHAVYLVIIFFMVYIAVTTNRALHKLTLQYASIVADKAKPTSIKAASTQPAINKPNMDNFGIQVWANIVGVRAYSYSFMNYKQQFSALSQFYLPDAWTKFKAALESSNLLNIALTEKMSVGAVATGSVTITQQGVEAGRYTWHVLLPLHVTLANSSKKIDQQVMAKFTIVRVLPPLGRKGLALKEFNAILLPK